MGNRSYSAQEKARVVEEVWMAVETGALSVGEACECAGIHRSQYYRWRKQVERYEAGETDALAPKSRKPRTFGRATPREVRDKVVAKARSGQFSSANAIAGQMKREGSAIHPGTVTEILEEEGLYGSVKVTQADGSVRKKRGLLV